MKRIVTAAAIGVAALSMTTTGAVAGSLVTSKQIKDKTIKVRDLAPATVEALRGAPGPAGATGPAGPGGTASYYQRTEQRSLSSGQSVGWNMTCDSGDLAVGGGFKPSGPGVFSQGSYPMTPTGGNGWVSQVINSSDPRTVDFYVVCVDR